MGQIKRSAVAQRRAGRKSVGAATAQVDRVTNGNAQTRARGIGARRIDHQITVVHSTAKYDAAVVMQRRGRQHQSVTRRRRHK